MAEFVRVDEWRPEKKDNIITQDGKLAIVPFDKIFHDPNIGLLNVFNIVKGAYVAQLDTITKYINYFIKFYDSENELLMSYAKLKFLADDKTKNISPSTYIQFLYNILLTDSIIEKIIKMTEDNYYITVSSSDGKNYNESLEFTEEHAKVLMQISIAMKLMIPLMYHYINKLKYDRMKKKEQGIKSAPIDEKDYTFRFYIGLFDLFGGDMDIYNKLYLTVASKINMHYARNKIIWDQRVMFGTNIDSKLKDFLHEILISQNMFKYVFNKNIIHFNHSIIRMQFNYFSSVKYNETRIEVNTKKDVNGLSGLDKLEMNATKIDESIVILSEVNIKKTIKRIEKAMQMKVSKDEIAYYKQNMKITKFQVKLVFYFYARYFGSYRDLNFLNRTKYIKLLIMLKRRLQFQGFKYLPLILSANIDGRINSRTIRNAKFLSKIETSSLYQSIINDKYPTLTELDKDDVIMNTLSTIINTKFTFVEYDSPEQLGEEIIIDSDVVSDEFLNYLNQL